MLFGRVRGTAICTIKYPGTEGLKLLVVQPLDKDLTPVGGLQGGIDLEAVVYDRANRAGQPGNPSALHDQGHSATWPNSSTFENSRASAAKLPPFLIFSAISFALSSACAAGRFSALMVI